MKGNNKFKRQVSFSILLIILLVLLGKIGEAGKVRIRVTVTKANIRLKPTTESMAISQAPLGAILVSEEKIGKWYRVALPPDEAGFVVAGYIHESTVELLGEVEYIREEKVATEEKAPKVKIRVKATEAEVRADPDFTAEIIGQAPQGTVLESVRMQGDWYKVLITSNLFGYIHRKQVEILEKEVPAKRVMEEEKTKEEQPEEISHQIQEPVPRMEKPFKRNFSLKGTIGFGIGFDKIFTGYYKIMNDNYEDIYIYPGGGVNVDANFGYNLTSSIKVELGIGYQSSGVFAPRTDEEVTFSRVPLTLTLTYEIPSRRSYQIYIGAGPGIYLSPEYKIVVGQSRANVNYNSSFGLHGLVGVIKQNKNKPFFFFGELRYVGVFNYEWNEASVTGYALIPTEIANLGGNGIFINFGMGYYF